MIIIAVVFGIEIIAIGLNRLVIRNADMDSDTYLFTVRYTGFSIFTTILTCVGLAYFSYISFTETGAFDIRIITAMVLFVVELFELARRLFFKAEVSGSSIHAKGTTFSFNDISKIEITRIFGFVLAEVFINDKKVLGLNSEKVGYRHFIERLKREENVQWVNILEQPIDKSIM